MKFAKTALINSSNNHPHHQLIPGEAQWGQNQHHEDQEDVELVHHAHIFTRPSHTDRQALLSELVCVWVCVLEFDGLPGPVGFSQCRVIHYGGQQGREGPQQNSGEELADNGIL